MPLLHLEEKHQAFFISMVQDILNATGQAVDNLRGALKKAWFKPKAKVGGDPVLYRQFVLAEYRSGFLCSFAKTALGCSQRRKKDLPLDGGRFWFNVINTASFELLTTWTASGRIEHEDPKRIAALAHRDL